MQLLFILFVAFIGVAKVTTFPHSELTTNIATDGAYTKQSTESAEADFITSVNQNHQHSTDVSTTHFGESTGLSNGTEGGGSDSTYPSRPIQSSDVYTSLKGVSDHVTAGPNQDFTTTGAVDDYTDSQKTSDFTENVGETEWDETYPHTGDAITDKFYDDTSTEKNADLTEDYLTMPASSTVYRNTADGGESRISTTEYIEEDTETEQQSTTSYPNTPFSDPVDNRIGQPSTSSYTD